ncbi:uncharacterized protein LOC131848558 [Achroia grisella]|uniref:uncharacterized protein LOC131848558 n=1 Tax=Achroia grisella TaxID=688607 RepID=UPI0027D21A25|nr:uncharacterized protein LOC131848558 [Achroia grisella]
MQFLRNRADILETLAISRGDAKREHKSTFHKDYHKKPEIKFRDHYKTSKSFVTSATAKHNLSCPFCNQHHRIIDCSSFKQLSPQNRCGEVNKLGLCSNCLRRGHSVADCRLLGTCKTCRRKHNTLLHLDNNSVLETSTTLNHCSYVPASASVIPLFPAEIDVPISEVSSINVPVSLSTRCPGQVLLGTVLVKIINPENKGTYLARGLLDAGSQSSFITAHLKEKIGLISKGSDTLCISGINNSRMPITDSCEITVQSCFNPFKAHLKCLVVPKITGVLPNALINTSKLNLPQNIQLADPNFFLPSDIDLLLGAEIFFEIMSSNQIKLGPNMPILQDTQLGWVVAGPLYTNNLQKYKKTHCNFTREISDQLSKFWNLEEVPSIKTVMSPDDEVCERHFITTTKRLKDGRFSVMMPLNESPEKVLGDSYSIAKKRFLSLEKKFHKNPEYKKEYTNFINEYEKLGHLTEIDKPQFGYFMPHHGVTRQNSETTKLRVVFDASAKTTSHKSLNDIQYIGPVVQHDLIDILVPFCQHKYVVSGDTKNVQTGHDRRIPKASSTYFLEK